MAGLVKMVRALGISRMRASSDRSLSQMSRSPASAATLNAAVA
jgi:hypothetical protein